MARESTRSEYTPVGAAVRTTVPRVTEAYVIDALRTPIGRYGGALANARPDDLAAHVIRAAVERNGLPAEQIDDVYFGCTNQAGEDNRNVARMALLLAGLPVEVPGVTVNRLCASGLEAVNQAARQIRLGEADLVLAGGVESMTRAPLAMPKPDRSFPRGGQPVYDTTIGWRFVNPRMEELHDTDSMGETAENVAERFGVSRDRPGRVRAARATGARSAAQEAGRFDEEIVPVPVPQPKGDAGHGARRRGPARRHDAREAREAEARLPRGRHGHRGQLVAAQRRRRGLVLASQERARELGREPLARIVSTGAAGVDPAFMGIGPFPATRKALAARGPRRRRHRPGRAERGVRRAGARLRARARARPRAAQRERRRDRARPSARRSGARLLGTLIYEMRRRGGSLRPRDDVHRRRTRGSRRSSRIPCRDTCTRPALLDRRGDRLPSPTPAIAIADDGFLRGDGAFEVLRLYDGKPFALGTTSTGSIAPPTGIFLD